MPTYLATHRLSAISPFRTFTDNGGLLSYGLNLKIMYRTLATYVSKILKGAKVGDLPVEQPTHFEFVRNLKTARTLGIKLPQTVLVRADEVIE